MRDLIVASHRGPYRVRFDEAFAGLEAGLGPLEHLVIDAQVAELYADSPLAQTLASPCVLRIPATEGHKSLERMSEYALALLEQGLTRDRTLVAVGGGIIQDIVCFLAATLLRGVAWRFYPTTLLAQADSCIGSKSSINVGPYKNQLGTFTPPADVVIGPRVLDTLAPVDLRSGIGEIIKVHVISGWDDVNALQRDYPCLAKDRDVLLGYIRRALEIKQAKIEADEFDRGERLVMNYGHTFGHAIESATRYAVPHGIAVTIGMAMANYVSWKLGFVDEATVREIEPLLQANYTGFESTEMLDHDFFGALYKDKKRIGADLVLVLMKGPGQVFLHRHPASASFQALCREALARIRERAAA